LNLGLIPRWGISGAAVAAALTNVLTNVWSLVVVRSELGLFPYNRSYARLLPPLGMSLAVLALVRVAFSTLGPAWLVIAVSLLLAYVIFVGGCLLFSLDDDDRTIAQAAWRNLQNL